MQWGAGEQNAARKPQEHAPQLKGVFGEGASVVAVQAASTARTSQAAAAANPAPTATPEQLQQRARRAQSRGLWTDGGEAPPSPTALPNTQPKAEKLPRAVVSTASLPPAGNAANTNYFSPTIGSGDATQAAAASARPAASAKPEATATSQRSASNNAASDVLATITIPPAAKGRIEETLAAHDTGDTNEITTQTADVPVTDQLPTPVVVAPSEPLLPDQQANQPPAGAAQPVTTSSSSSRVLIALIVFAAAIALLFIGAAVGLWNLPWMTHPSAPRKPARPEVTSAAPAAPAPAAPAATPVPAAPAPQTGAAEPAPVAEQPAAPEPALPAVPTMTAEEAAPAHNAADSEAEEAADPPSVDTASVISAAKSELRSNNPTAAEALLQPLLEANPDDHHIAEIMARALLARGDAGKALSLTQRIVRKRPKRASYRVLLGDALRRAGDEAGAQAAYREALALDPNERDAQRRLSR